MSDQNELTHELIELLKYTAFQDAGVEESEVAQKFDISKPKARYFLDELAERNYVRMSAMVGSSWYITKEGRKFLFEKDLL